MSSNATPPTTDTDGSFAAFDVAEFEVLDVADGIALPELGASSGSIGCSSSSSCCCSAC